MRKKAVPGIIIAVIGLMIFIPGVIRYAVTKVGFAGYKPVNAVVVDEKYISSANSSIRHGSSFMAVVEYEVEGRKYQSTENIYRSTRYKIGSTGRIYYDPQDPYKISLDKKEPIGLFMLMFGIWVILGGLTVLVMSVYENEPEKSTMYSSLTMGAEFMFIPFGIFILTGAKWHPIDLLLGLFFLIGVYTFIQGIVLTVKHRKERIAGEESYY